VNAHPLTVALTGATGYVGGRLLPALTDRGHQVTALARDPAKVRDVPAVRGDVVTGDGLDELLEGADVAYYLVHSMGSSADFADADRTGAQNFAQAAARNGVRRIVYLGGLEDGGAGSAHLASRHEVAEVLRANAGDVEVSYARAAMVLGAGSASFEILHHLVQRLPAMLTPRWVDTVSQPIAIDDVVAALVNLGERADTVGEAQLGGADALSYREMMRQFTDVAGRRPPAIIRAPVLTPRLSSYWVSLFTPVSRGLVRPLVDGLSAEMLVTDPPPPGVNDDPAGFQEAVRTALATDPR
jgi:uncharacterized protein YbjT (DUF2867 family)